MADGMGRKVPAGGGIVRRSIPTQRPGTARRGLPPGKKLDRGRVEEARVGRVDSGGEDFAGKAQQIRDVGEESGVAGRAAEKTGVFVLD